MNLVYGGGTVGIMGEVAKTLVSLSGPEAVHGIIPEALMRFERKFDEIGKGLRKAQEAFDTANTHLGNYGSSVVRLIGDEEGVEELASDRATATVRIESTQITAQLELDGEPLKN